jgi:hypothetical protein
MFNWIFSVLCTVVIVTCTATAIVVTVTTASYGHTPKTSYTLEIPGITCHDIKTYIDHYGWSDPHKVCH